MGLQSFERRLERMVEGAFSRVFRTGLRPVELGRRLARAMDSQRTIDIRGRTVVPNQFAIALSEDDHSRFEGVSDSLTRELSDAAREHARDEGYAFMGPVTVELEIADSLRKGRFEIEAILKEGPGGTGAGGLVVVGSTERYPLAGGTATVGRGADCQIIVDDPNVSRRHAEIRADGDAYVLDDLGSTNGTRVNGVVVDKQRLADGDEIAIGNQKFRFEAS